MIRFGRNYANKIQLTPLFYTYNVKNQEFSIVQECLDDDFRSG